MVLRAVQLLVPGLYLPPVLVTPDALNPAQTIISVPIHWAVWLARSVGAFVVLVGVQLFIMGL